MALTNMERKLVSVGASVAADCLVCAESQLTTAKAAGLSGEALEQVIADATSVRERAAKYMRRHALAVIGRAPPPPETVGDEEAGDRSRAQVLIAIGAAFATNCTQELRRHLDASKELGITRDEVAEIVAIAGAIKAEGASEVEELVEPG